MAKQAIQDSLNSHLAGKASADRHSMLLFSGVALLVLVVPFLFSIHTVEQFLSPKEYISRIVLALLGTLFCIRFFFEKQIRLSRTPIDLPLALLFLLALVSLVWNFNRESALRDLRGTILLLLLIPLVTNTVRKLRQVEILLWIMATAGTLTALLGILEAYGIYFRLDTNSGLVYASREIVNGHIDLTATYLPFFPKFIPKTGWSEGSILSTFGNRNYLATFAMFTAFIPLTFFFYYHRKWVKALSLISFLIILMGMFATRCRAAVLGLLAGFIIIALIIFLTQRKQIPVKKQRWKIIFIGLTIAGSLFFVTKTTQMPSFLQKFKTIVSMDPKISNTFERVSIWKVTYASFSSHPSRWLVGSGFGSFPHFCQLQVAESFTEKEKEAFPSIFFLQAHNDWLQLISELGLIGFGLLLFLLWRLFRRIYFALKKGTEHSPSALQDSRLLLIGLTGAMTALMTTGLFDFPFHRIEMKLYVLTVMGLIVVLTESDFFRVSLPETGKKIRLSIAVGIATLTALVSAAAVYVEINNWRAESLVMEADRLTRTAPTLEQIAKAERNLWSAIDIDPLPGETYLKLAKILEVEGKGNEAMQQAGRALKHIHVNGRSGYNTVLFRLTHISHSLLKNQEQALNYAQEALYLTTGEQRFLYYYYIGMIASELGQWDLAENNLRRALENSTYSSAAAPYLLTVLTEKKKWADAVEIGIAYSHSISDTNAGLLGGIGLWAVNTKDWAIAVAALKQAIVLKPDNAIFKRDLGTTYMLMGEPGNAIPLLLEVQNAPDLNEKAQAEVRANLAAAKKKLKSHSQ